MFKPIFYYGGILEFWQQWACVYLQVVNQKCTVFANCNKFPQIIDLILQLHNISIRATT